MGSIKLFVTVPDSWKKPLDEILENSPWDRRSDLLREILKKIVYEYVETGYIGKVDFSDLIWKRSNRRHELIEPEEW